ncbi:MAG: cobalamin biosynthesis protein CobD [Methylocystis sp.]|nr:cobalamin biosynthesis protein CobD [Methylocystis sp.]MBI3274461.1 cobalamin biosynthesis protein CobD [Methylocystis sp.]
MAGSLEHNLSLALLALAIEAGVGYPNALFRIAGHPATWLGGLVSRLDRRLNRQDWPPARRRMAGVFALATLILVALAAGWVVERSARAIPFGIVPLAVVASSLLAQRSLHDHVADVARALEASLDEGRASVAKIVGRDVWRLDGAGVSRAAIESLAENFCDGVVAPVVYTVLLGLPGALIYKAINTADSMIGHKTMRYKAFGWASARADDVANLPAARLAAGLIAVGAATTPGTSFRAALLACRRDAAKHASPNAGWPEAAMAGALGVRLGGPRAYGPRHVDAAYLGAGRPEAGAADISRALRLYRRAIAMLWLLVAAAAALALLPGAAAGICCAD